MTLFPSSGTWRHRRRSLRGGGGGGVVGGVVSLLAPLLSICVLASRVDSELDFSPQRDGIVNLNPLTIWSKVIQNKNVPVWLVTFCQPWCPFCKKFAPKFKQAAHILRHRRDVGVAAMDVFKYSYWKHMPTPFVYLYVEGSQTKTFINEWKDGVYHPMDPVTLAQEALSAANSLRTFPSNDISSKTSSSSSSSYRRSGYSKNSNTVSTGSKGTSTIWSSRTSDAARTNNRRNNNNNRRNNNNNDNNRNNNNDNVWQRPSGVKNWHRQNNDWRGSKAWRSNEWNEETGVNAWRRGSSGGSVGRQRHATGIRRDLRDATVTTAVDTVANAAEVASRKQQQRQQQQRLGGGGGGSGGSVSPSPPTSSSSSSSSTRSRKILGRWPRVVSGSGKAKRRQRPNQRTNRNDESNYEEKTKKTRRRGNRTD